MAGSSATPSPVVIQKMHHSDLGYLVLVYAVDPVQEISEGVLKVLPGASFCGLQEKARGERQAKKKKKKLLYIKEAGPGEFENC